MNALSGYLLSLLLTVAVELLVVAALAPRPQRGRVVATALCLNLLTHPLGTLAVMAAPAAFAPVELAILAAEAWGLAAVARLRAGRAVAVALVANGLTVLLALVLAGY